jgi:hypothetical protein
VTPPPVPVGSFVALGAAVVLAASGAIRSRRLRSI